MLCVYLSHYLVGNRERGQKVPFSFEEKCMISIEKISKIVDVKIAVSTNFVVDISVKPGNKIVILLDNDKGVSIDDCIAMSRHVESGLDRDEEDFELNVMSPGLSEPLKILRQYKKYIDKEVDVVTKESGKIKGKLVLVTDEGIQLETKTKEKVEGKKGKQVIIKKIDLTFSQIKETKIVISF